MVITPYGNNQTWKVEASAAVSGGECVAVVDFDVPNKPNPPPFKLISTLLSMSDAQGTRSKAAWEFTQPAKFGPVPLNEWVQYPPNRSARPSHGFACPTSFKAVFRDMGDGDDKQILISTAASSSTMAITP